MKLTRTLFVLLGMANILRAEIVSSDTNLNGREEQIVAAAKLDLRAAPRFNGAKIVGVHPRTPLIYTLAVSGERPMSFAAANLPAGLKLEAQTGVLTGTLDKSGDYTFKVAAKSSAGEARAEIKIVCGDTLALTPPLGWNSYDNFGDSVTEAETLANAEWLKEHLQPFGWDTVVVDFRWYDRLADGKRVQNPEGVMIDEFGRCVPPTNRFPSRGKRGRFQAIGRQNPRNGFEVRHSHHARYPAKGG